MAVERHKSRHKSTSTGLDRQGVADLTTAFVQEELFPNFSAYVKVKSKRKLKGTIQMSRLLKK